MPLFETLAGGSTPQAQDVPADKPAVGGQGHAGFHVCPGTVKNNGFLRQPLQCCPLVDTQVDVLRCFSTCAAIPLASTGCGDLRLRFDVDRDMNVQMIATGNARRWMQHDRLAERVSLRIQGFLHAERPTMPVFAQHRPFASTGEAEVQFSAPSR